VTGAPISEAVTVLLVTCRALAYWIAGLAAAVTVVCVVVVAGVGWAWRRAWRALSGRLTASQPSEAPFPPEPAERRSEPQPCPAPTWARTDKEAA
jgi:hypothetical protein